MTIRAHRIGRPSFLFCKPQVLSRLGEVITLDIGVKRGGGRYLELEGDTGLLDSKAVSVSVLSARSLP
jgi:hypothetical protein